MAKRRHKNRVERHRQPNTEDERATVGACTWAHGVCVLLQQSSPPMTRYLLRSGNRHASTVLDAMCKAEGVAEAWQRLEGWAG